MIKFLTFDIQYIFKIYKIFLTVHVFMSNMILYAIFLDKI